MKKLMFLFPSVFFFIFVSCATSIYDLSETEKDPIISRTYDVSFSTIYNNCMDVLQESGWIINNNDKESGNITTDYKLNDNVLTFSLLGQFRCKYSLRIKKINDKKNKVILTIQSEREKSHGSWEPELITSAKYENMSKDFWTKLNSKLQ